MGASTAWAFAGSAALVASQWALLLVLARLADAETVGRFVLALALTAPVALLAGLSLRAVLVTDVHRAHPFADYLGVRAVSAAAVVIGVAGVAAGYDAATAWIVGLMGVARAVDLVADLFHGVLQRGNRLDQVGRSQAARGVLTVAGVGGAVAATGSLAWGAAAMAAASALVLAAYDLPRALPHLRGEPRSAPPPARAARLAWTALPLGVVAMLISLGANVPRYFVEARLGAAELGIFAAAASLQMAGTALVNALGQAAIARMAAQQSDLPALRRLLGRLLAIVLVLGVAGVAVAAVAGGPLLAFLFAPEYARGADALVWAMAAAGVGYVAGLLGYAMTAARRFWIQIPVFVAACGAAAAASAWAVPRYGIEGAAAALLCASLVQAAASAAVMARTLRAP